MPGGDGTGPMGTGPLGWGRGPCGRGLRRGFARGGFLGGLGRGFGFRRMSFAPAALSPYEPTQKEETLMLEQEAKSIEAEQNALNQELAEVKRRIEELKGKK